MVSGNAGVHGPSYSKLLNGGRWNTGTKLVGAAAGLVGCLGAVGERGVEAVLGAG